MDVWCDVQQEDFTTDKTVIISYNSVPLPSPLIRHAHWLPRDSEAQFSWDTTATNAM